MMMKRNDLTAATALLINGYLRANDPEGKPEKEILAECLGAIRSECDDWAENLESGPGESDVDGGAIESDNVQVQVQTVIGTPAMRTPYTLVSAAISLMREAEDLAGPAVLRDFEDRRKVADEAIVG